MIYQAIFEPIALLAAKAEGKGKNVIVIFSPQELFELLGFV